MLAMPDRRLPRQSPRAEYDLRTASPSVDASSQSQKNASRACVMRLDGRHHASSGLVRPRAPGRVCARSAERPVRRGVVQDRPCGNDLRPPYLSAADRSRSGRMKSADVPCPVSVTTRSPDTAQDQRRRSLVVRCMSQRPESGTFRSRPKRTASRVPRWRGPTAAISPASRRPWCQLARSARHVDDRGVDERDGRGLCVRAVLLRLHRPGKPCDDDQENSLPYHRTHLSPSRPTQWVTERNPPTSIDTCWQDLHTNLFHLARYQPTMLASSRPIARCSGFGTPFAMRHRVPTTLTDVWR